MRVDGLAKLAPRLVRRAESQHFDVHPGELRYLLEDPAFVRTGISAAGEYELDLLSGYEADGYVVASVLKRLIANHALSAADAHSGNVRVRLVPDKAWRHLADAKVAPTAAVAIDLAEDPNLPGGTEASALLPAFSSEVLGQSGVGGANVADAR